MNAYIVSHASSVAPINSKGCGRMQLNILVLQQNLKNIEPGVDLARAANYFTLLDKGADEIIAEAKKFADQEGTAGRRDPERFSYDELKTLVELCYSEQLGHAERGVAAQAQRKMADKLLGLSEVMWQS
jgi:exocyst complex component 4